MTNDDKKTAAIIAAPVSAFVLFLWLIMCATGIPQGKVGLTTRFGKFVGEPLKPGFHMVAPWTGVTKMTTKFRQISVDSSVLTEDNLTISVEATIFYKNEEGKYKYIYSNFSASQLKIEQLIIKPTLRSAVRKACATMDWNTLSSHRGALSKLIRGYLKSRLNPKGFVLKDVMINDIQPPQRIKDSVMSKLKAQQEVTQMKFEKQKATKEAEIRVVEATGIARSQTIIQKKLTPIYVQYIAIQAYKQLAQSKNKTFVIMPTSTKGAGMPLILNAKD